MVEFAIILAFATWRITSLLYIEAPFTWLRKWIGIVEDEATNTRSYPCNLIGDIFECFWCLSLVVSFALVLFCYILIDLNIFECFLLWLASSAGAIVIDTRFFARYR